MYKILFTISLFVYCTTNSIAQKKAFEISSQINNLEGKEVSLTIWEGTSQSRYARVPIINGQFHYKDSISSPLVIRVSSQNNSLVKYATQRSTYPTKSSSMWFIAQPGSKIKMVGTLGNFAEAYPIGDKENEMLVSLTKEYFPILNQEVNLRVKLAKDSTLTVSDKKDINKNISTLNAEVLSVLKKHLKANKSSIMALYFINDMLLRKQMPLEEAEELLKGVDDKYKVTGFFTLVNNRVNASKFIIGNKMMEISARMPDGKLFSNISLRGKYYLIDFWGTWCGPCMAGMPNLIALKQKHEGKLELLGIDQGDSDEVWKNTITEKGLDWYHIKNGKNEKDYVAKLNIAGFPTKILVGPDGTILYRSTGESPDFNQKIEQYIR